MLFMSPYHWINYRFGFETVLKKDQKYDIKRGQNDIIKKWQNFI